MFNNDDQEMNRIYQESLHPKDYSKDGAYSTLKNKKDIIKSNAFKQDIHGNVNRYSANKNSKGTTYTENTKTMVSILTIVGIIIVTLIFIVLPLLFAK